MPLMTHTFIVLGSLDSSEERIVRLRSEIGECFGPKCAPLDRFMKAHDLHVIAIFQQNAFSWQAANDWFRLVWGSDA